MALETFKGIWSPDIERWHVLSQIYAPHGHFRAETMCGFGGNKLNKVEIKDISFLENSVMANKMDIAKAPAEGLYLYKVYKINLDRL